MLRQNTATLLHRSSLLVLYTIKTEEKGQASRKNPSLYFSKIAKIKKIKKVKKKFIHLKEPISLSQLKYLFMNEP